MARRPLHYTDRSLAIREAVSRLPITISVQRDDHVELGNGVKISSVSRERAREIERWCEERFGHCGLVVHYHADVSLNQPLPYSMRTSYTVDPKAVWASDERGVYHFADPDNAFEFKLAWA